VEVDTVPEWFLDVVTSEPFYLVVGALLASLMGYLATLVHDAQKTKAVRRGLGTLLHAELVTMSPPDDPITHDPDQARRLVLRSLPQLLAPGVLDPDRDTFLMMELIFLASVVDDFNERARLYDEAYANGEPPQKMQLLYNALWMSTSDYRDAHRNVTKQLWQLGPPMPLNKPYKDRTLRERFDFWRSRGTRQEWIELQKREGTYRG
jgi:hypothetical protein